MPSSPPSRRIRSGCVVLVGLTWAFWQHSFSGLRHLFLDMGAGYELKTNKLVLGADHRRCAVRDRR